MERISERDYNTILEEIKTYGRSGKIESVQTSSDFIDKLNQSRNNTNGRESSVVASEAQYGRENNKIQRLGKNSNQKQEISSNRVGNNESGDTNKQGNERYSLKDILGNQLTEEQAEFFKDSKVRDENGSLQVVYHGTEGEFYTFDKALRGTNTGAGDAKLGFFFTSSELVARDYNSQ